MKISFTIVAFLFFFTQVFATAEIPVVPKKANEIYLPVGNNMQISLTDLSYIKVKDFEKLSGKHLNFVNRLAFKASQKKLRNSINSDGSFSNKKLGKLMSGGDHSTGFHIGGFALGFFLGLIGVLLAYIIKTDEDVDRNRTKWAWIGFGLYAILVLVIVLASLKAATP